MNGLAKHTNYLAIVLAEAQHVGAVLQEQDAKIAELEREADDLGRRNSELCEALSDVTMQRDALQRAHDRALAVIAEHELRIR